MQNIDNKLKGRGAVSQIDPRYLSHQREASAEDWESVDEHNATEVRTEQARTVISRNRSPDLSFQASINPYRGCEHGCIYCYARPSHAYLDLSPGLDFERKLFAKTNAPEVLQQEINAPGYQCKPIMLGANTDPYQPIERRYQITREIIRLLLAHRHPLFVITKSKLVERDIDLLSSGKGLVKVLVSINSLNSEVTRTLEPRATAPARRVETIRRLNDAGIHAGVLVAPIIPALNDHEIESVLAAAAKAGAQEANYTLLRLPQEVAPLFKEWLTHHHAGRAKHVMSLLQQMRSGKDNDARFGWRMRGTGPFAELIAKRFRLAVARHRLNRKPYAFDTTQFRPSNEQLTLF